MRLRRLDLARYGKFTDQSIDFGEALAGTPDLHVVYGPNEAGKSTAFAGFLDLLFGIEMQSRYNFLHPYETMRVGGCLELSCGPRELVRIKKPQPTLRDAGNQPVPDGLILGDLGGLDRNAYRTMFSLDDETLEAGGDSILASNGELGQLLFSASAGLAELSKTLTELRAKTDGFTWPNARSGELHQLKAGLTALKAERDKVDTLASEYNRLAAARDAAALSYDAALSERSAAKAGLERVRRLLTGLPRFHAHRRLLLKLEPFAGLPAVPLSWLGELPALEQAELRHRSDTELAEAEVKRLSAAVEVIAVDERALGLAGGLDRLTALAARNLTAEIDLPVRRRELARADGEVSGILAQLGRDGDSHPDRLRLTAVQSATFEDLMETRSGIEAKVTAANEELSQALLELTEARQVLQAASGKDTPGALPEVVSALQALRESDHLLRLQASAKARLQHSEALTAGLASLAPWVGDAAELAVLAVPDEATVQAWQDRAEEDATVLARRRDDLERLEDEERTQTTALDAVAKVAGLLSDQEAAEVRSAREAAWAGHRRALDPASADVFEAALRRDDIVGSARLGHERDLAKLHELAQAVTIKQAEVRRAETLLAAATAQQEQHAGLVANAAAQVAPVLAGLKPAQFLSWMRKRDIVLGCWSQLRQAEPDARDAEADGLALRNRLQTALKQAGIVVDPVAPPERLAAAAQSAIEHEAHLQALRKDVAERERDVRKRELAVQKTSLADKAWLTSWRAACSACWLGEASAALPFGAVRGLLAAAAALGPALKERSGLDARITGMEDDQVAFGYEVERLTTALGIEPAGRPNPGWAEIVSARVQTACLAAKERQRLQEELVEARSKERDVRVAAQAHANRVSEMMNALQAGSLIEVAGKLRDAHEQADLLKQAAEAERDLMSVLQVESFADADAVLNGVAQSELQVEEAKIAAHLDELEQRTRELFAASKEAADRINAIGGDDAAARIEERRRTQLLDIGEKASQHLRLRLGIAAADRALRAYRDQHRSSMMTQASHAFALISRGAYRGLTTQPGKDGDILVATGADGGSKLAADLSKGTRFQLYLALRAAGYREFAKVRRTVPFVADDVMETFDDFRAEETLKVLGEMSLLGQVIYLTHHDHLRVIAERTVPGVRIHKLG